MTKKLGWGILSTGRIAGIFAQGLARAENSRLIAVGSRTPASAEKFAAVNGGARAHGSYEALLADPEVRPCISRCRIRSMSSGPCAPPRRASTSSAKNPSG